MHSGTSGSVGPIVHLIGCINTIKCLFKALIFTHVKNILIYSELGFQLYQSHSLIALGLKSGKKSMNWVSGGILEILR